MTPHPRRSGFTLIELLVVISIIMTLAGLTFPTFSGAREKARQTSCISNQRQIALAVNMWCTDHDESFPHLASIWGDLNLDRNVYVCLTKGKRDGNGFVYSSLLSEAALGEVQDPTTELLIADGHATTTAPVTPAFSNVLYVPGDLDFRHKRGVIVTYVDCHTELVKETPPFWLIEASSEAECLRELTQTAFPVLATFYNAHETATPLITPLLTDVAHDWRGRVKLVRVDLEKYPDLAARYAIAGTPTFVFLRRGEERARVEGIATDTNSTLVELNTKLHALVRGE
jgi:prepilin-type N-terminal cleavage/methylation domain-containing protein